MMGGMGGGMGMGIGMGMGMGMGRPGGPMGMPGRMGGTDDELGKPYDHRVISRLFDYVKPYRKLAALAGFMLVVSTGSSVAIPYLIKHGVSAVARGDGHVLNLVALAFVGSRLLSWIANYFQLLTIARVTQSTLFDLRVDMFKHMHKLSMKFYDANEVGRVMSRVQNDTNTLQEFLQQGVMSLTQLLSLVGIAVVLFFMDVQLAFITLAVAPILILVLLLWQRWARSAFIQVRRAIAVVNPNLNENISGVRVVQSLNRQEQNGKNFDLINRRHMLANFRTARLSAIILPVIELLSAAAITTVIVYGAWQVLQARPELRDGMIAVLIVFVLYIQRFFDPIRQLTMMYTQLQQAMASGARVFEFLDTPSDLTDAADAKSIGEIQGDIRFEHVFHSYSPTVEVLHDIDLHIRPGETVALVGETGAGKTTITALIPRLYDCTTGRVLIDGQDVSKVTIKSLTKHVAMVLQDPFLFSDTVRENIRYGRLDATDAEVETSAKTVFAHDFIVRLAEGYDTVLSERGSNFSTGQRQLISFARAVLADPKILILDEATANIDTHTEMLVQRALGKLLAGRTSVVIAHRLSTIRNATRIVVLERGRIMEIGNHEELMAKGERYFRLYTMNYAADESRSPDEAETGPGLGRVSPTFLGN